MIIEFIGLPGAGKSTAKFMLLNALHQAGVKTTSRQDLINAFIAKRFHVSYPKTPLRKLFSGIHRALLMLESLQIRVRRKAWNGFTSYKRNLPLGWLAEDTIAIKQHQRENNKALAVLDEGFYHHLAAALVWCPLEKNDLSSPPEASMILVHIKTDISQATNRLIKRGIPATWPNKIDVDTIQALFAATVEASLQIARQTGVTVYELDWTKSPKECEKNVAVLASKILSSLII